MGSLEAPTQEVMQSYRDLVQESQRLLSKIAELEMDRNEHRLVEETIRPLDPARRAYRLVGEVLVERTVGEVLPSVTANREKLDSTITAMRQRMEAMQKEADDIRSKYNLE